MTVINAKANLIAMLTTILLNVHPHLNRVRQKIGVSGNKWQIQLIQAHLVRVPEAAPAQWVFKKRSKAKTARAWFNGLANFHLRINFQHKAKSFPFLT